MPKNQQAQEQTNAKKYEYGPGVVVKADCASKITTPSSSRVGELRSKKNFSSFTEIIIKCLANTLFSPSLRHNPIHCDTKFNPLFVGSVLCADNDNRGPGILEKVPKAIRNGVENLLSTVTNVVS
nr:uncharacterized protein LOC107441744 [Parasteatoda tepidariorum]